LLHGAFKSRGTSLTVLCRKPHLLSQKYSGNAVNRSRSGGECSHLEVQGIRKQDVALLYAIQQSEPLVAGRLQITLPDKISTRTLDWLNSRAVRFDCARIGITSVQAPFRDAGLQTLLILWRGASEENMADKIADEINLDRVYITG
jgi:hypothetical protein